MGQTEETVRRPLGRFYGMALSGDTPIQRVGRLTGYVTTAGKKGATKPFLVLTVDNLEGGDVAEPGDKTAILTAKEVDAAIALLEKARKASLSLKGNSTKEFMYRGSGWFSVFARVSSNSNVVPQIFVGYRGGRSMLCGGGAEAVIPVLKEGQRWLRNAKV